LVKIQAANMQTSCHTAAGVMAEHPIRHQTASFRCIRHCVCFSTIPKNPS